MMIGNLRKLYPTIVGRKLENLRREWKAKEGTRRSNKQERSTSNPYMPVQGLAARDEVRWVLFREDNDEPRGYALVQTPKTREDQQVTSVEIQRPSSSKKKDLIEALWQEKRRHGPDVA